MTTQVPEQAPTHMTGAQCAAIERIWLDRAKEQGYKPGTKRYATLELEFFCGAMAVLQAQGVTIPPYWVIAPLSGRPIADPAKQPA